MTVDTFYGKVYPEAETAVVRHRRNVQRGHTHKKTSTIIRSDGIQKHRDLTAMENLITTLLRLATMTFRSAFFNTAFQHAVMQFSEKINDRPSSDATAA